MTAILIVDDSRDELTALSKGVEVYLRGAGIEVRTWMPSRADPDAHAAFERVALPDTILVATDEDLTSQGQLGLFGPTIADWCQERAIPVAKYTRKQVGESHEYPDLFEIRVPAIGDRAAFIGEVVVGFEAIAKAITSRPELLEERSPAAVLSKVLGEPSALADLALYAMRLAPTSGVLMGQISDATNRPSDSRKEEYLAYIAGHLLLNAVLKVSRSNSVSASAQSVPGN